MIDKLKQTQENNDVQTLAHQIKDKIKAKETEIQNPISYSVGKGDKEITILAQPLQQEASINWSGDKFRDVKRTRYIAVGSFGIGAIDFVGQVKFDATDNKPIDKSGFGVTKVPYQYPPEGEFIDISQQSSLANDEGFLRNIRSLDGIDKMTPPVGITGSVGIVMHNYDGLITRPDGKPGMHIGNDFGVEIHLDVKDNEFLEAFTKSVEASKKVELNTDKPAQVTLMSSVLAQM